MTGTKQLSLHGRLRMAAACPDPNAALLAEAADAIERHEAFRQEVSDAISELSSEYTSMGSYYADKLKRFIIAKPDPLVEVVKDLSWDETTAAEEWATDLRAAIAAWNTRTQEQQT